VREGFTSKTSVITRVTHNIFSFIIIISINTSTFWWVDSVSSTGKTLVGSTRTGDTSVDTMFTNGIVGGIDFSISGDTWAVLTSSMWFTFETFVHVTSDTMWEFSGTILTFRVEVIIEVTIWAFVTEW
jgi:hypothetical protein